MEENMEEFQTDSSYTSAVTDVVENYGWYLLISAVILLYLYSKVSPFIDKYLQQRSEQKYAAKYHKNPDEVLARLEAQQLHAAKLQEKYDEEAEAYNRKVEEKKNRKREDWLQKNSGISSGSTLGGSSRTADDKTKKSLKPEYNPLMGNTSTNYRPPKKSGCRGGGCGK